MGEGVRKALQGEEVGVWERSLKERTCEDLEDLKEAEKRSGVKRRSRVGGRRQDFLALWCSDTTGWL